MHIILINYYIINMSYIILIIIYLLIIKFKGNLLLKVDAYTYIICGVRISVIQIGLGV